MKKRKTGSKRKLFDADIIVTEIYQHLVRDLNHRPHEYDGGLHPAAEMLSSRQIAEGLKKYVPSSITQSHLELDVFEKFEEINEHMRKVNLDLNNFPDHRTHLGNKNLSSMDRIFLRARALMHFALDDFTEDEWFRACRHGTGSSIGTPFSDTSLEKKWTYPLTATKRVKDLFLKRYLNFDFQLKEAIENHNGLPTSKDEAITTVRGSRATTVDKTCSTRRLICVEPTLNMFFQQGLMHLMYEKMRKVGLDVERLPIRHQKLACEGSISGNLATIDFSSASDCVSIELLRWLMPVKWFDVVDMTRSPYTVLNGKEVCLSMFATMGNATTFPIETLVFWTLAHATILECERNKTLFPEHDDICRVSVFGDDCILPTQFAIPFMEVAESVGFFVNKEKSFFDSEVRFRESCGGDYLAGDDVRPYYFKAPTSQRLSALGPWLSIIFNRILRIAFRQFGPRDYIYRCQALHYIISLFQKHGIRIHLVPSDYPDDAGLKLFDDFLRWRTIPALGKVPLYQGSHGQMVFHFYNFQYRKKLKRSPELRYCVWLKNPVHSVRKPSMFSPDRRIGGYVVAKGISAHWAEAWKHVNPT